MCSDITLNKVSYFRTNRGTGQIENHSEFCSNVRYVGRLPREERGGRTKKVFTVPKDTTVDHSKVKAIQS